MNSLPTSSEGSSDRLNLDDSTWWKRNQEPSGPLTPMTPMTFSFLAGEQRNAFNFPTTPQSSEAIETAKQTGSPDNSSSSPPSETKRVLNVKDLLVIEDEDPIQSPEDTYKPKSHLGWASFGEAIAKPPKPSPPPEDPPPLKRKVYVVKSKPRVEKPPQLVPPPAEENSKALTLKKYPVMAKTPQDSSEDEEEVEDEEEDEIVDVVGIDEEEKSNSKTSDLSGKPPDLPPQRPLNTRFESQRQRKDYYSTRRGYDSDEEEAMHRKMSRLNSIPVSPPPRLERQLSGSDLDDDILDRDDLKEEGGLQEEKVEKMFGLPDHNPAQLLKTKVSSSALAVFPQSKSIMEHKKAAIEMTKHAVIKRVPAPKSSSKNMTVAPKSVQVPAYAEKTSITLYSKMKPPTLAFPRDNRVGCFRCRERPPVDMANFKFLEDTNVVAVRAHLCDQTRVMIARTALWNREYARRLGDRASGTLWQKPDEVTAQMTGFCSATVRRCIDIANMSIVPKCADRIGVSKNELSSLQNAFGNEKFCGQPMRTPHVLSQYYAVKQPNPPPTTFPFPVQAPPRLAVKPTEKDEEAKKHDPIAVQNTPSTSTVPSAPSVPTIRKTVLRWPSIQSPAPRILRPPVAVPRTAVIPVRKDPVASTSIRKRGRPRKERTEEEERNVRTYTRRLRSSKKNEVEECIREVVEAMVDKVVARD